MFLSTQCLVANLASMISVYCTISLEYVCVTNISIEFFHNCHLMRRIEQKICPKNLET